MTLLSAANPPTGVRAFARSVCRSLLVSEDAHVSVCGAAGAELDVGSLVAHAELADGTEHDLLVLHGHAGRLLELQLDGRHGLVGLDVDLHGAAARQVVGDHLHRGGLPPPEPQHQVEGALLLDVVVGERAPVLELLPRKNQTLLVGRNPFLVLDLRLDVLDGVGVLHLEGDGLSREGLHEDLHATAESQHQVQGALLLDVVVREGAAVLKLLSGKDKTLLVRRDALLVLNLRLDVLDGVRGLDLEGDGLSREGLHEDLHGVVSLCSSSCHA
mmetsp:Transcript_4654/g.11797  ORF Transcript_4654/g.11797 Transcript_4654/m.11797 type:complete len:272 (-) Transcript_4654:106-921(-)